MSSPSVSSSAPILTFCGLSDLLLAVAVAIQVVSVVARLHRSDTLAAVETATSQWKRAVVVERAVARRSAVEWNVEAARGDHDGDREDADRDACQRQSHGRSTELACQLRRARGIRLSTDGDAERQDAAHEADRAAAADDEARQ